MISGKLARNLREVGSTALDMLLLRYPGFVYGEPGQGAIPVFCFHGAEPESLEEMLQFLASNSYITLDADGYHRVLTGDAFAPTRSVVLTFDDGWGSMWSVAFPLLKRYDMRVIIFLPSGRIEHCDRRLPDLDDLHAGRCSAVEVLGRDSSDHPLLTWEEIAEMHASGLVDFQSHSYNHALIPRSTRIVDFVHPCLVSSANMLELSFPSTDLRPLGTVPPIRLGEPLYDSAPRLSDVPRAMVDPAVAEACVDFADAHGGSGFFDRPDWRELLERVARKHQGRSQPPVETSDAQIEAIRFELSESKRAIEAELPGKTVRHMCYPWHVMGSIARNEALKAGYATNFLGKVGSRYYNPIPNDPQGIARLGGDFFFRLPGKGRVSLYRIVMRKAARRAHEGSAYLTH